ncbi:hypothetical protein ACVR0S_09795 [Streptococcus dentapri]|uniref:Uncharacterized protein n=1 Tax=Streptococcus dentapri TaxID=573564 RepID=A0ABV8D3W3_9STRE
MDQWELICRKVSGLEEDLYQLDDWYRDERRAIEEKIDTYAERQLQFNTLMESKYETALYDFRQRGVQEYQELTNLVEAYLDIGHNQFLHAFRECDDQLDELEQTYKKKYNAVEEKLQEAYAERRRIDLELLDQGK